MVVFGCAGATVDGVVGDVDHGGKVAGGTRPEHGHDLDQSLALAESVERTPYGTAMDSNHNAS